MPTIVTSTPISPQRWCPRRFRSMMTMTMPGEIGDGDRRWRIGDDGSAMTIGDDRREREQRWERRENNKLKREEREKRIKKYYSVYHFCPYSGKYKTLLFICGIIFTIWNIWWSSIFVFGVLNVPKIWHLAHLAHLLRVLLNLKCF